MERGKKFPTQKGNAVQDLTEDQARAYVEKLLWPDGQPVCRKCGSTNAYRMVGKTCRAGLCRCRDCKKQFTVTVGTIFEDSHLPLRQWVRAIHMMASSKKGISALQLQRNLGLGSYKTAWFMAHRIRLAMKCEPVAGLLTGHVEIDETYVGGKPRPGSGEVRKRGRGTTKAPVVALVERKGRSRAHAVARVDGATLREIMHGSVDSACHSTRLATIRAWRSRRNAPALALPR
jgi:transposase-like protein